MLTSGQKFIKKTKSPDIKFMTETIYYYLIIFNEIISPAFLLLTFLLSKLLQKGSHGSWHKQQGAPAWENEGQKNGSLSSFCL